MNDLLINVIPLLLLIAFGFALRRMNYFEESTIKKLTSFVANVIVPCVIFNTILNLEIRVDHIVLSASFFLLLAIITVASYIIYKVFHLKRKFFVFFNGVFSVGLAGISLFSATFGAEHMEYMAAITVGHELFIALIFVTGAKIWLADEKLNVKTVFKNLRSPLFIMVAIALILNLTGWADAVKANVIGNCVVSAISKVASITTPLTMIIIGYLINFKDKSRIKESFLYAGLRLLLTFGFGYLLKFLLLDHVIAPDIYFDYAYFTVIAGFGSAILIALVGQHGDKEEMEVCSNAYVINVITFIAIFVGFVAIVGAV